MLALRLQQGDPLAVTEAYERYRRGLFTFCARLLSDPVTADDVVQDTFMIVMTHHSQLRDPSMLKSWIFTIARNECFSRLKRKKMFREFDELNDEAVFEGPMEQVETEERIAAAEKLLNALIPQYKEVLLLREFESMSYDEIAAVTRTTVSSVKSRLFKARRSMMKILEPYERRKEI